MTLDLTVFKSNDKQLLCNYAEKNCDGVEESGMEGTSANNYFSGGSPANSYPTCIFRLTLSFSRRMNSTVIVERLTLLPIVVKR